MNSTTVLYIVLSCCCVYDQALNRMPIRYTVFVNNTLWLWEPASKLYLGCSFCFLSPDGKLGRYIQSHKM